MAIAALAARGLKSIAPKLGAFGSRAVKNSFDPKYLATDAVFGGLTAIATPGDLVDRGVMGIADLGASALAGGAARALPGMSKAPGWLRWGADAAAGMGGAELGYGIGGQALGIRHGVIERPQVVTPLEREIQIQERFLRTGIADPVLRAYF